jgi:uncharacterized RDD family membrane protein YckC
MPELRLFDPHPPHRTEALRGRPLASFQRRGVALALDFVIAGVTFGLVGVGVVVVGIALGLIDGSSDITVRLSFYHDWYSVLWLFLFLGASNHFGNGRTLGKRLMKIRAVSLVHDRLHGWPAFERALAYGASALELGFGFIQYFIHPNRQTVHDRIAETIVVDERQVGATDVPR